MKVYFYKEIFSSAFIIAGRAVPFEGLNDNNGVIALDTDAGADPAMVAALNEAADEHRGGIVRISEAEYTQKKTEQPLTPSRQRSRGDTQLRVMPEPPQAKRLVPPVGHANGTPPPAAPAPARPLGNRIAEGSPVAPTPPHPFNALTPEQMVQRPIAHETKPMPTDEPGKPLVTPTTGKASERVAAPSEPSKPAVPVTPAPATPPAKPVPIAPAK